ncbi:MAG: ABC-ATPase domain-containing protein, partial [Lachnospiraceae bacterium]|nr:ABC-ATPase domain-containing protein [Lachnospiraceae bacterium]
HVQGDPFASPSDVSIHVPAAVAGFPAEYFDKTHRRVALQDLLTRTFGREAAQFSFKAKGSGKSGLLSVSRCGQEIIERSACRILPAGGVVLRFHVGFPANGRTINARELMKIFFEFLPRCAERALKYKSYPAARVRGVIELADDQEYLRGQLTERGLAAFVADGSVLPRESGVSSLPMKGAVPFRAPESLAVTIQLPHAGARRGMGIPRGITMIAGGGYHGKSTLLKALELGVYNHIAGDGREYVVTDSGAMKLRAEDGRSITGVDISMFIRNLPNGKDTARFSTEDASGSTSQAANVVEAMEAGSRVFLIDEDTSATNFMIRDELMQRVINRESEPIIPFIDRVEELYQTFGISTILVAGSCGSYFHRADHIIQMKQYQPVDITELAKREAAAFPLQTEAPDAAAEPNVARRIRCTQRLEDRVKVRASGVDSVSIDREVVDLRYVEQLADPEQVNLLGQILKYAIQNLMDGKRTVTEIVDAIEAVLKARGMEGICGGKFLPAGYALPRRQEIAACINRYRRLRV